MPAPKDRIVKTQKDIDRLASRPPAVQTDYRVEGCPGLTFRVAPTAAVFTLRYRVNGGLRRATVGHHPAVSLRDAKNKAAHMRAGALDGIDPSPPPVPTVAVPTMAALWDRYVHARQSAWSNRTATDYRQTFDKHIMPRWGRVPITDIRRADVRKLLTDLREQSPAVATKVSRILSRFFRYAVEEDILSDNPARDIPEHLRAPVPSRDRVLSAQELAAIWEAAGDLGYPFGLFYRFCLATGLRREAVASLRWDWIDPHLATVTFPPLTEGLKQRKTRNPTSWTLPLSPLARQVLDDARAACPSTSPHVFATKDSAVSGFSVAKRRLDKALADRGHDLPPWRLHDFRRALCTHAGHAERSDETGRLAGLEMAAHLATGHNMAQGVQGVYNRASHFSAAGRALDWWADFLIELQTGQENPQ